MTKIIKIPIKDQDIPIPLYTLLWYIDYLQRIK